MHDHDDVHVPSCEHLACKGVMHKRRIIMLHTRYQQATKDRTGDSSLENEYRWMKISDMEEKTCGSRGLFVTNIIWICRKRRYCRNSFNMYEVLFYWCMCNLSKAYINMQEYKIKPINLWKSKIILFPTYFVESCYQLCIMIESIE